jgi:nucleotide-binding universal stress UspA family protein
MIKRIIVPLDPSEYSANALNIACTIAKIHDAEVTGLVILDIPGITKSIGPVPLGASYFAQELEHFKISEADKRIHNLLEKFKEKCNNEGIKHKEHARQGTPSKKILEQSLFYDMIVMGMKTHFDFETSDEPGSSFEEILDASITPIFAIPKDFKLPNVPSEKIKVLIAFDGSLPACRAVQRFAQLQIAEMTDIKVLMSHEYRKFAEHYLSDVKDYLNAHKFNNVETIYTDKPIIEFIEKNYLDWPDMFVLGMHAKRVLFDFIVGSLTKFLIKYEKKPIFIGQ